MISLFEYSNRLIKFRELFDLYSSRINEFMVEHKDQFHNLGINNARISSTYDSIYNWRIHNLPVYDRVFFFRSESGRHTDLLLIYKSVEMNIFQGLYVDVWNHKRNPQNRYSFSIDENHIIIREITIENDELEILSEDIEYFKSLDETQFILMCGKGGINFD